MAERPFVLGLTGSIGMGKSETAKMFASLGVPVYDADRAVHVLYEPGGAAVAPLAEAFPEAVREGRVDRAALARRVQDDPSAFRRLEDIVHPLVAGLRRDFLAAAAQAGHPLVVLDIPLLFETGGEADVDAIVVVSAPEEIQRARVLARPDMTLEKFEAIRARQMPDSEKRAKADFVIDTGKGMDHALKRVGEIVEKVRNHPSKRM